jgi:SAM-dependent methyltransferase
MADAQEYRRESRARWGRSATGWSAERDAVRAATMPVSAWMVDAVAPQPGDVVLELAAGIGDTGFLAAELIQPSGTLICSDFAPEMLTAAQERAAELGIANVRFRQIDAESIDEEAASLDGVLCRWGYMLMADPVAALRETRRVLKPGAPVALAAWTDPAENLWSSLPGRELVARGLTEPPDPDAPGQFAWAREGLIADAMEEGGFVEPTVTTVEFTMGFRDVGAWWDATESIATRFSDAIAGLDAAGRDELRAAMARGAEPFQAEDGRLEFPARTWVAMATA